MQAAKRPGLAKRSHGEQNEAGFNLRETLPLPRNILHSLACDTRLIRGSDCIQRNGHVRRMSEAEDLSVSVRKDAKDKPDLPLSRSGYREERDWLVITAT
jgi:hypothetical protein